MRIDEVLAFMRQAGARQVLCKKLAPNDNSKNQVYVAGSLDILNVLPMGEIREEMTLDGTPVLKASLDFYWLGPDIPPSIAPSAQLILYPQYPEVRLSGFLRGAAVSPNGIMVSREAGRTLFLGIGDAGAVFAFASVDQELAGQVDELPAELAIGAFKAVPIGERSAKDRLLARLAEISNLGWVVAQKLSSDGTIWPCGGPNCGGYTLEALLGIAPNGRSEPDFEGWELKTHSVTGFDRAPTGNLTLMTPEPTEGLYRSEGVAWFVQTFGYPALGQPDRQNFSSPHRFGTRNPRTQLTLSLDGFRDGKIENPLGAMVLLDDADRVAAAWPFAGLLAHWNRKHAQAAYVANICRGKPDAEYLFGSTVRLGEGTNFLKFLSAVSSGTIFYDPGIKVEDAHGVRPRVKRRSQFRIRSRDLGSLYENFDAVLAE